jgi:hypothetical protein
VGAAACLLASTDFAGDFIYYEALAVWARLFGEPPSDALWFGMQKAFHVALFAGFGAVSGAGWDKRRRLRFAMGSAVAIGAELAQALTSSRTPLLMDGVLNVASFFGGAALARLCRAGAPHS